MSQSFSEHIDDSSLDLDRDPFAQNMKQFYHQFAKKLEILDPLDRPILDEGGADQAIKCKELGKRIKDMAAIPGTSVVLTLNPQLKTLLLAMINEMQDLCNGCVQHYIDQAMVHQLDLRANFQQDALIRTVADVWTFFVDFQLLADAPRRREEFQHFVEDNSELIRDAASLCS